MLHYPHNYVSCKTISRYIGSYFRLIFAKDSISKYSIKGFILFPILILMLIISLFGLYALTSAGLAIKMQSDAWDEDNLRAAANAILKNVEKKISIDSPNCFINISNPTLFTLRPLAWWQASACNGHFKHIHYYYVIENFGEDACARIENENDLVAEYYRITLFSMIPHQAHVILQSTVVKGKKPDAVCIDQQKHVVTKGKQMQRELIRRVEE